MYIVCYLLGLLFLYLIFSKKSETLRNTLVVVYNYIVAVALYAIPGFAEEKLVAILRSVYLAPEVLGFDANLDLYNTIEMTLLFLIIALCTIRAAILLLFKKWTNTLTCKWRIFWAKHIYVVWGFESDAKALIEDTKKQLTKSGILYIPNHDTEEKIYMPGVLNASKEFFYTLRKNKEYHIALLPDEHQKNLEKLNFLNNLNCNNIHVAAYIDNALLRLQDFHYDNTDSYIVSKENLLARNFLIKHLPLETLINKGSGNCETGIFKPSNAFRVLLIGFTDLTQEFLLSTYENTAFETLEGSGLKATIIDTSLDEKKPAFFCDYPQIAMEKEFEWCALSYKEQAFFDKMLLDAHTYDQIIIDTGCTDLNIKTTQHLLTMLKRNGFVASSDSDDLSPQIITVLHENADGTELLFQDYENVILLQGGAKHFTYNELFLRETDAKAEALHDKYNSNSSKKKNWQALGTFTKTSNRNVIWDIPNKLLLAGDLSGKDAAEKEKIYWQLAQYEHLRWNAFHFAHGWSTLPISELTEDEIANCKTKRPAQKKHTCLVDWDTLDTLPQEKPGILKWYDYENVVGLFGKKDMP